MNNSDMLYEMEDLQDELNITFEDVVDFWMTLFPEIKTKEELEKILIDHSKIQFKDLEENYYNNDNLNLIINKLNFTMVPGISKLDDFYDEIQQRYQWTYFFKPIINSHVEEFYNFIKNNQSLENKEDVLFQVISSVVDNLYNMAFKVLVLETNINRMEDNLIGETSKEKAQYFIKVLLNDKEYLENVYNEYPELTRLMNKSVINTFNYVKEIIENTSNEIISLEQKFNKGNPVGKIKKIELGAGDTHNSGKTVAKLVFSSDVKVIYKPRFLDLESKFSDFIDWINSQEIENFKSLKSCTIHTTNDAGWMEFIEHNECNNEDEVKNFYMRTGQFLTLLYMFNAKDFHFENLIANGEHPILIDLETLLHPDMIIKDIEDKSADAEVLKIINDSVKTIALLPTQVINHKTERVLDVGGLCGETEQEAPFKSIYIKDFDSDEVRVEQGYGIIKPKENNPIINGTKVSSDKYVNEIKEGFTITYKWILSNKEMYVRKLKELFEHCLCRVVFRPTNVYCQLLSTSYHPDLLRNSTDRYVYLHRIGLIGNNKEIISSELKDMYDGDVPYFVTYVNENKILNGRDEELSSKYYRTTLDTILNKIEGISEKDLVRQITFINLSYADKLKKGVKNTTGIKFQEYKDDFILDKQLLVKASRDIGDFILEKSIVGTKDGVKDRTWIGTMEIANITSYVTPVGYDLYGGNSGIALYLAYLGVVTGDSKYKSAALESIKPVLNYLDELETITNEKIGVFSGVIGQLYSIYRIGQLFNDEVLVNFVKNKILIIKEFKGITQNHDIISGYSGALAAILSIYDSTEDQEFKKSLLDISRDIFTTIKENIVVLSERDCITWGKEGYVGYSHGNVGVETQLMRLYKVTGDTEMLQIIKESLAYSRSMFDEENENWKKDLNKDDYSYGWCHGAPGILLGRLMLLQLGYRDEKILDEIHKAIETTKKYAFGIDYSLCHGDIGNNLILNYAANILEDNKLKVQCEITLNEFLTKYLSEVWETAEFVETFNLGLMVGMAGIGYGLLHANNSQIVPNILSFI